MRKKNLSVSADRLLQYGLAMGAILLAGSLSAQQAKDPAPSPAIATPTAAVPANGAAATTNAAAAASEKKKPAKKKAVKSGPKKEVPIKGEALVAGPATVLGSNVNVRGQAKLNSEVVNRLNKGQSVTVLDEVILKNSGPDEPSAWAKILLPAGASAWVNGTYLDPTNKTVTARKLQVRAGAGEQYSTLGMLKKGDTVKEQDRRGDWVRIEAPGDAYGFVAAQYLKQEAPAIAATTPPVEPPSPPPTAATVPEPTPIVPANPPTTNPSAPAAAPATTPAAPAVVPAPATPPGPPPKRIVQREGLVRGSMSIQAPTPCALVSPDTGRIINYLYAPGRDLKRWKGLRVVVTGEEGLDERWPNTPLITLEGPEAIKLAE